MILTIDIGNTSTNIGIFDVSGNLLYQFKMASDKKRSEDEYGLMLHYFISNSGLKDKIEGAIISSVVVTLTQRYQTAVEKYLNIVPKIVNHKINTGVKICIDNPQEIGADRIANGCAALKLYSLPAIVVDFGTSTNFDIINSNGEFIGGIIAAGLKIQADALYNFASKLPKLKIEEAKKVIGSNTIDAMLSGVVRGHGAMIEGLLKQCETELGQRTCVIATGGYSEIVSEYMERKFDYIDKELTLKGLYELYRLNWGKKWQKQFLKNQKTKLTE